MFKRAVTGLEILIVAILVGEVIAFVDYYDITKNFTQNIIETKETR